MNKILAGIGAALGIGLSAYVIYTAIFVCSTQAKIEHDFEEAMKNGARIYEKYEQEQKQWQAWSEEAIRKYKEIEEWLKEQEVTLNNN